MLRCLLPVALLLVCRVSLSSSGPVYMSAANNVVGSMPNPAGNPPTVILVGSSVNSTRDCEIMASTVATATSWTYHHCNFPHAGSGNYSCHCYARTDGKWAPASQQRVDSGDLGRTTLPVTPPPPPLRATCKTEGDCGFNGEHAKLRADLFKQTNAFHNDVHTIVPWQV